jgi:hypothetical protein
MTGQVIEYGRSGNSPEHDSLLLPNGKTVGETSTEELRPMLARFNIPHVFTAGRAQIVAEYARISGEIFNEAGRKALDAWLAQRGK